jgi:anti-sigma B factor antagonist
VDFIESTGLGALIGGRRRAHALKGSLVLVCTEEQMLKIFRITGLDKVFTIHDSVEAATATEPAVAG